MEETAEEALLWLGGWAADLRTAIDVYNEDGAAEAARRVAEHLHRTGLSHRAAVGPAADGPTAGG